MKRKGRGLRPEERQLWQKVAETTSPLDKKPQLVAPPFASGQSDGSTEAAPITHFRVAERARITPKPSTRILVPDQPLRMDRKAFIKMKRGKSDPDARIDLHGMTAEIAHATLLQFLYRVHADGQRLVLVITGKGRPNMEGDAMGSTRGVLRRQVPYWLDQPPLRQIILQTAPAHQKHGGDGALYVYLRR